MKAQLPRIQMASDQLTGVCNELDRLARRIESIRNAVVTSAAAAAPRPQPPARGTSSPPTVRKELSVRKELPPVPGLTTRPEVIAKVKAALRLDTKKEAKIVAGAVVGALEETLIDNLGQNGYSIKLGKFGKFSLRHRPGTYRIIPLTGETNRSSSQNEVKRG